MFLKIKAKKLLSTISAIAISTTLLGTMTLPTVTAQTSPITATNTVTRTTGVISYDNAHLCLSADNSGRADLLSYNGDVTYCIGGSKQDVPTNSEVTLLEPNTDGYLEHCYSCYSQAIL